MDHIRVPNSTLEVVGAAEVMKIEWRSSITRADNRGRSCEVRSISTFVEDLKNQGFTVKFDASFKGRSGATHHVDVLAENPQGKRIVAVEGSGNKTSVDIIRLFAISLDGEADAYYVVEGELNDESWKLVEYYKITS